jgi:hypothetical protein
VNDHLAQEGVKRWDRLMERVDAGQWPSDDELWSTVILYGVPPLSEAGRYVGGRLLGTIRRGRGNPNFGRMQRPVDAVLRAEYYEELRVMQGMKEHAPDQYRVRYTHSAPSANAIQRIADRYALKWDTARKSIRRSRG